MRDARTAVAAAHRDHWAAVLAATVAFARDLDLAEDAVQDAFLQAIDAWRERGVPENPAAWLTTAARRRALDAMRREATLRRKLPLLVWDEPPDGHDTRVADDEHGSMDEQLRLIFLAAHPALAPTARVALTLRLVGGLTTAQIAAAFLVPDATMAARITRAKKRIALSRIPCRVPPAGELPGRLVDVLDVLSVLLATGERSPAPTDPSLITVGRRVLEALARLLPRETEPRGLLAQALLLESRSATRHDGQGRPVALADQDRRLWDRQLIERADSLVRGALAAGGRGPYLIQGAISAAVGFPRTHEEVDWHEAVHLYDALLTHWPTAIVRLGRAVALAQARGPREGLKEVEQLADDLGGLRRFHIVRGELFGRLGQHESAAEAYRTALSLPGEDGEADVLRDLIGRHR